MECLIPQERAGSLAWLGRRPHTAEVAGSNPARPTKKNSVECSRSYFHKEDKALYYYEIEREEGVDPFTL